MVSYAGLHQGEGQFTVEKNKCKYSRVSIIMVHPAFQCGAEFCFVFLTEPRSRSDR